MSVASTTGVVRLAAAERNAAADMLTRAFWDDPYTVYMLPDEGTRSEKFRWFANYCVRAGQMSGEVYGTPGTVDGTAVWMPAKMTAVQLVRSGLAAAPFRLGWGPFGRFINSTSHLEPLRKLEPVPHWYLLMLGVEPARQGQGLGGALIAPVLARADAEEIPCYLETTNARNLGFYRKHGFEVVVEGDLPKGGPHFWTMRRAPRGFEGPS